MQFKTGQRWISDSESELGLGVIIALDARRITLYFPASEQNRLYSVEAPPITRIIFQPGDIVSSVDGWKMRIDTVHMEEGVATYIGTRCDTQQRQVALREIMLDSQLVLSKPQERLFAGQLERSDRFALRYRARRHLSTHQQLAIGGLLGGRTDLIPHQLYIAHEVGQRYAPRVLLADEVGLGKTIEAGMIMHQQLLVGRVERVLVVVPENLLHQWLLEMRRRFNLHFALFDQARYQAACGESDNPFETEQLILCSLEFVRADASRRALLVAAGWDLLVVDEAHHLAWSQQQASQDYLAIEQLAQAIPGVLLLTATPEQFGEESHFARLRLLDPDRFHDFQRFIAEQRHYQQIAGVITKLQQNTPLSTAEMTQLTTHLHDAQVEPLLEQLRVNGQNSKARQALITQLMDRHGTGRVMFRNTRQSVPGFPQRQLHSTALPLPQAYRSAYTQWLSAHPAATPQQRIAQQIYPECPYHSLDTSPPWWQFDPRVEWLSRLVLQHRHEKIVVICAYAATAQRLEQVLREREGVRAALFHEEMTLIERDRAAAWFASVEAGASLLICSEIGSEGRNFQFAHRLVMFDLPAHPDLLEQRIGRLDRIGQQHNIAIHVVWFQASAQEVLFRFYQQALQLFAQTSAASGLLFEQVSDALTTHLLQADSASSLDAFIAQCEQQHTTLKAQLEQGRDRLLELHSQGGAKAQALVTQIAAQDNDAQLINFALQLFDIVGINQEERSDNLLVLTPSEQMLVPTFPGLPQDGCTITFDRNQALAFENAEFITWEHPLLRDGLDLILANEMGCCAVATLRNLSMPAGTLLLELIYVVEAQGAKSLQLTRFLPPTPIRLLLDRAGNNNAQRVAFEMLNRKLMTVNRFNGSKVVNAAAEEIRAMLAHAERQIKQQAEVCISDASERATSVLDEELNRLLALQRVNPLIREDEIMRLRDHRQRLLAAIQAASWRLDALRLIVVMH